MTADEIKSKISFKQDKGGYDYHIFTGTLHLECSVCVSSMEIHASNIREEIERQAFMNITEQIMRTLYDDQRNEICKALRDYMARDPFSGNDGEARNNLIRAVLRSPKEQMVVA